MKKLNKYKYIYLFIVILATIGFISGYLFYNIQDNETKENIQNEINIQEELNTTTNNTFKRIKESSLYLVCGLTIIPEPINIFNIYYEPFTTGFIFNTLKSYGFKFSIIYTSIYYLIPLIFKIILLRITMSISYINLKYIFKKNKSDLKRLKLLLKKYLLITIFLIFYEILIFIFNPHLHSFLMTILSK